MFQTQQYVNLQWKDPRIDFHNLKLKDTGIQNSLVEAERAMIWIPRVKFLNTPDQKYSLLDNKSLVTVERQGEAKIIDKTNSRNAYVYSGLENTIKISRVYSTSWLCDFEMRTYPFDTQVNTTSIKLSFLDNYPKPIANIIYVSFFKI